MKHYVLSAVVVNILLWTAPGRAQEAVTIKFRTSAEGDSVTVSKQVMVNSKVKVTDGNGTVLADLTTVEKEKTEYKETIIKREPNKTPTKLERAYTKAENTKGDETTDLELAGKTVVIEKKTGKFTFAFKGGDTVEGPALASLSKEFAKKSDTANQIEKLVTPKNPVKPGDSWKLDMGPIVKEIAKDGEGEMDAAKATGTGKLLKVYQQDGKLFGVMQFKLEIPVKSVGKGAGLMKFENAANLILELTMDGCIDGSSDAGTMKMKMVLRGTASIATLPGGGADMNIVAEETTVQRDATKK